MNRVIQLLETPLDQAFLPMGQNDAMAAAAALGREEINVHVGSRDSHTKEALLILRRSQELSE
ncbi:MAG TPA: hypothetical protein DCE71_06080 [Parachlamydiales bacterium]|nr:hypothetical protein [Parachlamydiales bacterium]